METGNEETSLEYKQRKIVAFAKLANELRKKYGREIPWQVARKHLELFERTWG